MCSAGVSGVGEDSLVHPTRATAWKRLVRQMWINGYVIALQSSPCRTALWYAAHHL
ncbi:hypothetical protein O5541_03405 [Escherichia coli]|nr:hypothetical protein [Escherichia coli]